MQQALLLMSESQKELAGTRAAAMVAVMRQIGLTLDKLQMQAPRGFWQAVQAALPEGEQREGHVLSGYWKKNQPVLSTLIHQMMLEPEKEPGEGAESESGPESQLHKPEQDIHKGIKKRSILLTKKEELLMSEEHKAQLRDFVGDGTMRALHSWWKETKGALPVTEIRPTFKKVGDKPMYQTAVYLNRQIYERAVEQLKADKQRTGGSFSSLVELLLWQYVGSPEDLLED